MTHITFLVAWAFSSPVLNSKKIPFFILTFGILFVFMAIRYDFGNDYRSYYNIFIAINEGNTAWGSQDILYKYLNLLAPNFYILIVIISLVYMYAVYFLIRKNLQIRYYGFAVLLLLINPYLFLVHLSSLRQTLAICFVIFAVHFAVKRKLLPYIGLIIIAAGFHKSAIILLPIYFLLTESKISKLKFLSIFSALILLFFTPLFDVIINQFIKYFPLYGFYVDQQTGNSLRATLISSFFFFLILFNLNKLEGKEIVYGKLALVSATISILAIKLSMITRIGMYFDIFLIIAIPLIFSKLKGANRHILFVILVAIYLLRYISFFNNPIWEPFFDYNTIMSVPLK